MHAVVVLAALSSLGFVTETMFVAAGHIVAIGIALAVRRLGHGALILLLLSWTMFVVDWGMAPSTESTLLFAACWMSNLTSTTPAMLLRGPVSWYAPVAAAVMMPLGMVLARPEWSTYILPPGVFVTALAITVATRIGLSYLLDYTGSVDAEARQLEQGIAALAVRRAATHQAAEDARVLHDTAINTLGAIANGGAAIRDLAAVRQRCLADVAAIDALRSTVAEEVTVGSGILDAVRPIGIRVRYTGLSAEDLARVEASLPPQVLRALSRAVAEAVQNAAKHSGADEAMVSIDTTADGLQVQVSDQGIGIQGQPSGGAGIRRSILERAAEAGIRAAINSNVGQGTVVTLHYSLDSLPEARPDETQVPEGATIEDLVSQLRWRSVYALSAGLVGVGVVLAALNHPGEATPEWLMAVVVALTCGLAWRERDRAHLTGGTVTALLLGGPLAFALSAWSVDFGRIDPALWQAVAPTGPLMVLMIVALPQVLKAIGIAAYLSTVGLTAAWVLPNAPEAAAVTVIAGLVGVGLVVGVLSFVRSLSEVAARAIREQREAFSVQLELATVEAAAEARHRWREAGLDASVALLCAIGEGREDPLLPSVRQRCAEEEAYLRQLTLLNPELIQMGAWFARALNVSRLRGVRLTVRAGDADATSEQARQFGRTLLTVVDILPRGTKLITAFLPTQQGLRMTMVAPTPYLRTALSDDDRASPAWRLKTLGSQDLAEFMAAGVVS